MNKKADILDNMIKYIDSNFAKFKPNKKLIENYVFIIEKAAISYLSKFQLIVILSTCEIEYITIYKLEKKAI